MAGWLWLVGLVVGLTVIQLLVYQRLRGRSEQSPLADRERGADPGLGMGLEADPARSTAGDHRRCPFCGAENDAEPVYTYCAVCVRRLQ